MKLTGSFVRLVTSLIVCSTVVIACSVAPNATQPEGAGAQAKTAEPTPAFTGDCLTLVVEAGEASRAINDLRRDATTVVVGTFVGYGEAQWTTPDGHRPTAAEFQADSARLVRPLEIQLPGEVKGAREAANHAVQRGGTSGCDNVSYSNEPTLVEGQKYVFFLVPLLASNQSQTEEFLVLDEFPVGGDGRVNTPVDGVLTMDEFTAGIQHGRPSPPAPSPGEPEPTTPG